MDDVLLRFSQGKVVEARAARGESLLHAMLGTDEGARRAGEVAVGTNRHIHQFTKNILLDEKMG